MTTKEIIQRLNSIVSMEPVFDGLKVGAITKECFVSIQETAREAIAALSRDRWISVEDGNTIIPMCFIHPEAIWGVTEEDCMKCKEVRVCRG